MNPQSASAFGWAALIVNFLGLIAISPGGQFIASAVAGVIALIPANFSRKAPQILGAAALAISVVLIVTDYPEYETNRQEYRERQEARSKASAAAPLTKQEERR